MQASSARLKYLLFFFNDTATTEIYTLSPTRRSSDLLLQLLRHLFYRHLKLHRQTGACKTRSEERFSRNAETDLVCRLLLEKKKKRPASAPRPRDARVLCAPNARPQRTTITQPRESDR